MEARTPTSLHKPTPAILILVLVSTAMPVGLNMYVPALAAMQADLRTSAATIQLTLSLYLAATAVGQIVAGPVSDMLGRRPVLLAGMGLFTAGSLLCAFAPAAEHLLFGRMVQALGAAAGFSLARAIIRDVHGAQRSASLIGYVTMGMAIAPMITPVIGGYVAHHFNWRMIFDLMAAYGGAVFLATVFMLPETHTPAGGGGHFRAFFRESRRLLALGDFWIYAGTLALLSSSFFSFIAAGTFVAVGMFGLSPSAYGLYLTIVVIGYIAGNFVTARFGARIGLSRLIVIGNATALSGVLLATCLFLFTEGGAIALFGPMLLLGLGNGFALPNAVAGAVSVKPELAGTSSGLAGAFQVGGGAVVSLIVGVLIDASPFEQKVWVMLLPMLVGSTAALALGLRTDDRRLA